MIQVFVALVALSSTDLTFVRHAETLANATGKYSARTLDEFSDIGKTQIATLTAWLLRQPRFDAIYVSPSPRAMKTITPYLKAAHVTATIWPLLYECCTQAQKTSKPTRFVWDGTISVPLGLAPYFRVVDGMNHFPSAPDYASGLAQVRAAVDQFPQLCAGKRVLIVGHSGQGGHMLHALTGTWRTLNNATPIRLTVQTSAPAKALLAPRG
jgi:broad specificity phosphatase PhoE